MYNTVIPHYIPCNLVTTVNLVAICHHRKLLCHCQLSSLCSALHPHSFILYLGICASYLLSPISAPAPPTIRTHCSWPICSEILLPWISSLNVQYWFWYLFRRRNAFLLAKSSNWIRQFMPYLWDKAFTLKEVNEITFKNKSLKVAWRKVKTFFTGPTLLLGVNMWCNACSAKIWCRLTTEKALCWYHEIIHR